MAFGFRADWIGALKKVGVTDIDGCMLWAFGKDWGFMPLFGANDKWNELHTDIFVLFNDDPIIESMKRIGKAYLKHLKG